MTGLVCKTCGTKYSVTGEALLNCAICDDDRQYVPTEGQQWIRESDLALSHKVVLRDDDGVPGIGLAPAFAINQRAIIARGRDVSVMWECVSLVTDEAVTAITRDGAIDCIAISHPHFYSAMHDWSAALGGIPIYIHERDRNWTRPGGNGNFVFWAGDELALSSGMTLLRCGGHFPGSTALHWCDEGRPGGALLSGDALQVSGNRKHVSFMYSYPNAIPMHPDDVTHIRSLLRGRAFDKVYGYTWRRNIVENGRAAVDSSFRLYFDAIGMRERTEP